MDKYLKFVLTLSITVAVLLLILVVAMAVHYFTTRAKAKKLLQRGKRGGNFIYELLKTSFPKGRIFKQVMLPIFSSDGKARRYPADIVLVDHGGVYVIRVCNFSGAIDNTDTENWTVKNSNGITEIPNPFNQNRGGVKAIESILRRENIYNIPIYNIVVFSGKKVNFRIRNEKLLTSARLIDTLKDMNRSKFLNQMDITETIYAIKKYLPRKRVQSDASKQSVTAQKR